MDNIWGEMLKEEVHNKCVSSGKSMHIAVVPAISILGHSETHLYFILSLTSHSQALQRSVSLCMMECTHCSPLEIKLNEMSI